MLTDKPPIISQVLSRTNNIKYGNCHPDNLMFPIYSNDAYSPLYLTQGNKQILLSKNKALEYSKVPQNERKTKYM